VCILAITGALLTLGIGFYFIDSSNPWAVDVAVLVSLLGSVFVGAGTLILSIRSIGQIEYLFSLKRTFTMLKDGWHLFASQFTSMLYTGSGPIVINYLLDAKAAGSYSITDRVVSTIMAAALLSHTAAYPRLAAAYLENKTIYFRTLKLVIFWYLAVTIMVAVFAWMMRGEIIQYLFGSEAGGEHLNLLYFGLMWLVLGIFGTALTGYLTISGRGKYVWPLTVKVLVFSVVTAVPGIWLLGSSGWLAALVLSQSLVLYTGFKYWKVESGK
jgi:O-antigen/teichoic acid export membrane protein